MTPPRAQRRRRVERARRLRRRLALPLLLALAAAMAPAIAGLPRFGAAAERYGLVLNRVAPEERRSPNVVGAVIFDLRAFDTLGEEMVLLAAVVGSALLLRHLPQEEKPRRGTSGHEYLAGRDVARATQLLTGFLLWWSILLGLHLLVRPHLTPGGGFQAGLTLAGGLVAFFLARPQALQELAPGRLLEAAEVTALGAFVAIGCAGLFTGDGFLGNFLPLGRYGEPLSAGTIPLASVAAGGAVAAGALLFLDELARPEE